MTPRKASIARRAPKYDKVEFDISQANCDDLSNEAPRRLLVQTCSTVFHGSGTCAVGAVVDTECRVLGFRGLRVVDASVFPFPIRAHYQAAVCGVAEQMSFAFARLPVGLLGDHVVWYRDRKSHNMLSVKLPLRHSTACTIRNLAIAPYSISYTLAGNLPGDAQDDIGVECGRSYWECETGSSLATTTSSTASAIMTIIGMLDIESALSTGAKAGIRSGATASEFEILAFLAWYSSRRRQRVTGYEDGIQQ
ncbi:GMC oxidoreductase-domain-containing protein [Cadophora sp. MPI-SDFR-AT-0126]|nr:GMC oxidoreductase-domain-containing protein [Leotiomycetes sp. MPI-SDFR-AT-0126]